MTSSEFTVTSRELQIDQVGYNTLEGYLVTIVAHDSTQASTPPYPQKVFGKHAFARVEHLLNTVDVILGEPPEVDGDAVVHIGDNFAKHYYTSSSKTIPSDVQEWLNSNDLVVIDNVDGGWDNWDGRPEWSNNYIDFSGSAVLEV